mgnify:CR=1 FL=1
MADCEEVIASRRSVRDLSGDVPEDAIRRILSAGARAPSPHNTQPWRFVVLGPSSKSRLATFLHDRYLMRFGRDPDALAKAGRMRERVSKAPLAILLCLDRGRIRAGGNYSIEWTMATQSLAAAAENMWLAALSVGLDAAWFAAPLALAEDIRRELGLEGVLEPQILMLFGRRAAEPRPKQELGWRELTVFLGRSPL